VHHAEGGRIQVQRLAKAQRLLEPRPHQRGIGRLIAVSEHADRNL